MAGSRLNESRPSCTVPLWNVWGGEFMRGGLGGSWGDVGAGGGESDLVRDV